MIYAYISIGIAVVTATIWYFRSSRGEGSVGRATAETAPASAPKPETSVDAAALERTKLVIHGLLQGVSDNIDSLVGESAQHDNSLDEHGAAIKKAMTIAGIQELERVMLAEIEAVQQSNSGYREQLDYANSKVKKQQDELERLQSDVGRDFLTGLPNRRAFDERLADAINRTNRYGTVFSLLIIDVDHFKLVNDKHGHLAGDRILRAVAALLDEQKRSTDFLARYGGEEFALILPETVQEQAMKLAEKTQEKVERSSFRFEKNTIKVKVSIGVGQVLTPEDTARECFTRVDAALYRAKERGRNRVELATTDGAVGGAS